MTTSKPTIVTMVGSLTWTRHDTAEPFHCGYCDKDKKSKNRVAWKRSDNTVGTICNGCYGEILSKER